MENRKTGFLILHYKDFKITDRCIASILSLKEGNQAKIIIVDNGSCNESAEQLQDKYKDNQMIDILVLDQGYGFSRGNNIGYQYVRKHCHGLDFLVVANNDIVFGQKDFIRLIEGEYRKYRFVIMGMDMIDTRSGSHLNPKYKPKSEEEIREWLVQLENLKTKRNLRRKMMYRFQQSAAYPVYVKFIRNKRPDVRKQKELSMQYADDRVLQGGCLVFSKTFLKSEEHLFWPETRFYCEEDLLYLRCRQNGWKILYSPRLQVWHEQGASFKAGSKSIKERIESGIRYNTESAKILLAQMRRQQNQKQ